MWGWPTHREKIWFLRLSFKSAVLPQAIWEQKQINKREKSIETGSVTDGNRRRDEGKEKMWAIWRDGRLFFASVLLLCFTSLSKKTVFSNLSHWEMGKRSDASAFYGSSPKKWKYHHHLLTLMSFQTCMTFAKDHKRRYFEEWTLDAPFHEITMKRTGVFIKEAKASNNIHKSGRKTHALHSMPSDITQQL